MRNKFSQFGRQDSEKRLCPKIGKVHLSSPHTRLCLRGAKANRDINEEAGYGRPGGAWGQSSVPKREVEMREENIGATVA